MGATRNCREKERTDMNSFYKAPGTPDDNQDNRTRTERAHHESQIVPVSGVSKFPGAGRAVRHCYINLSLDGNQWCALFGSDLQQVRRGATALVKALENQKEGDPIRIKPLASGLANLVGRMNPNRTMVSSPDRMTIRRFYDIESEGLGYGATFFLPCWLPNRSGAAVKKQVRQFVAALEDPFDPREIKSWVWPFTVRWVCTVIQSAGHGSESHEKHHQS
jgi:hypothetical protein